MKLHHTLPLLVLLTACSHHNPDALTREEFAESLQASLEESRALRELLEAQQQQIELVFTSLQQSLVMQADLLETHMRLQEDREQERERILEELVNNNSISTTTAQAAPPVNSNGDYQNRLVVGAVESVLLPELGIVMPARIDTGATTSSIDASDITEFERNGERWVRFTITDPGSGELVTLERRRTRLVRIIQSTGEEGERRPVVALRITLGNFSQVSEFTLTARSHLGFPMLIGRNVLRDVMVVDVGARNIVPVIRPPAGQSSEEADLEEDEIDVEET